MLPTTQEYKISLMIGQDSFRTLEGVEVIPNPNYPDEPWYSTGGLAIVFKLKLKEKLYALKCFYTEANERQERLGLIAAYLKQNPSPYFVDFTYLENELWVQTANDEGQGYPVVLMEWVEGKTLDNYLEQTCTQNNTPALKNLYFQFCNLAWWLQQQPIAHGDIKHDNLIVTPDGKLKLIDYDGVFVPALRGRKANEMGSPCYQHPQRDAYFFDKNLDDFSLLVLQITLLALQHQPQLFTEHYNGDGIILKDSDYQNFAQSPIKTILWQLPEVKIPLLLSQLQGNINNLNAIDLMPLLQDVAWINWLVGGQKDGKLEFERQRLKELFFLSIDNFKIDKLSNLMDSLPVNTAAAYLQQVMYFSENPTKAEVYKEGFRVIMDTLVSEEEKKQVLKAGQYVLGNRLKKEGKIINRYITELIEKYPTIYGRMSKEKALERVYEEEIASMFVDSFDNKNYLKEELELKKQLSPLFGDNAEMIAKILSKIFRFFKSLFSKYEQNRDTLDVFFSSIKDGKYKGKSINGDGSSIPSTRLLKLSIDEYDEDIEEEVSYTKGYTSEDTQRVVRNIGSIFFQLEAERVYPTVDERVRESIKLFFKLDKDFSNVDILSDSNTEAFEGLVEDVKEYIKVFSSIIDFDSSTLVSRVHPKIH